MKSLYTAVGIADPITRFWARHPGVFTNTQENVLSKSVINALDPQAEHEFLWAGNHATEALVGAVKVPSTSTVQAATGVSAYVTSEAPRNSMGGTDAVGGLFTARALGTNANVFGINPVVSDTPGFAGQVLQNEFDVNVWDPRTAVFAVDTYLCCNGTQPGTAIAYSLDTIGGAHWTHGFYSQDGAAMVGITLGTLNDGNGYDSQPIDLVGRDATGVLGIARIYATSTGIPVIRTGRNGAGFIVQDYNNGLGNNLIETYQSLTRFYPLANGTETMRIVNGGNVGIGTNAPTAKLHVVGNFIATGTKSALVETATHGSRELYAVESTENWFEDFGNGRLEDGKTTVPIDSTFGETVNTAEPYHVFLTANGRCSLYVSGKAKEEFSVEVASGDPSCAFDYRIVAKRRGYEDLRLAAHDRPEIVATK
ncbi:MAG TPA: hypothetical protein VFD92_15835 [Candidatus Binatia bacterium]|nr:hypothetical protein [Candidatus Binatia bacterium]